MSEDQRLRAVGRGQYDGFSLWQRVQGGGETPARREPGAGDMAGCVIPAVVEVDELHRTVVQPGA